jgi:hypothetical protein
MEVPLLRNLRALWDLLSKPFILFCRFLIDNVVWRFERLRVVQLPEAHTCFLS